MDNSRQSAESGAEPFPSVYTSVTHEGPTTSTITTTYSQTLPVPASPPSRQRSNSRRSPVPTSRPLMQNRSSTIRLRRIPSTPALPQEDPTNNSYGRASPAANRRRSASEPQGPQMLPTIRTADDFSAPQAAYMSPVHEETMHTIPEQQVPHEYSEHLAPPAANTGRLRSASNATRRGLNRMSSRLSTRSQVSQRDAEYESEVTDLLDVVGKMSTSSRTEVTANVC
jgi:hypothetical protein